jgi:hypothetical protein
MKRFATVVLCFMSVNGGLLHYAHATTCTDLTDRTAALAREVPADDSARRAERRSDDDRVEYTERTGSEGRRRSAD